MNSKYRLKTILFFTFAVLNACSFTSQFGHPKDETVAVDGQFAEIEEELALIYRMSFINLYAQKL